ASSPAAPNDTAAASSPPPQSSPAPANYNGKENAVPLEKPSIPSSSPVRNGKKKVNYAESDDEDDEPVLRQRSNNTAARSTKRRKLDDDSDDDFAMDDATEALMAAADEADMQDFVVDDDASEDDAPVRRKKSTQPRKPSKQPSPIAEDEASQSPEMPSTSTAQQWNFDPDNVQPYASRKTPQRKPQTGPAKKQKAHMSEPDARYPWLADIMDAERNRPGTPDYDPRTLYIPPLAWSKFSPFEKQYWEIKSKFWDTIVFFKKGKFYELYENDATIGHQLFDLKMTDRVNMRMVGVPEASLDHWANQFVAKGF
ncbi:DNA mismatch repair protein Msh6, partial [Aureobasidium melanogenum]